MNKKGISIIALTVTIIVITIIVTSVVFTGASFKESTDILKFEKSITLIEKTMRKEYIKGNIIGISLEDYEKNLSSEQSNFDFTQEELNNIIENIKSVHSTLLIDDEKSDYYLLNREYLLNLGLNEIYEEYLVNYKKGFVFCLNPILDDQGNNMYTTQYIKDN